MRHLPAMFVLPFLTGCEALQDVGDVLASLQAPLGDLSRADLVTAPSVEEMGLWGCYEILNDDVLCGIVGARPAKSDMLFSFDLVFDLENPNQDVPIPLVELLLGFTVFEGSNLGAACLSFCDPDAEDCVPTTGAVDQCELESETIDEVGDLIPTVEELFTLAEDVVADGAVENGDWRVIPGGQSTEAHIQFDLGIDTMLDLADDLLVDAAEDLLSSRPVQIDIPYSADGTLFFEAPALGRKGVGFGPLDEVWTIK